MPKQNIPLISMRNIQTTPYVAFREGRMGGNPGECEIAGPNPLIGWRKAIHCGTPVRWQQVIKNTCCKPPIKRIQNKGGMMDPSYSYTTHGYLASRCKSYKQNAFNFMDNSHNNTFPTLCCGGCRPAAGVTGAHRPSSVYKRNNPQFRRQGAVSVRARLNRLKYNTIVSSMPSMQPYFGGGPQNRSIYNTKSNNKCFCGTDILSPLCHGQKHSCVSGIGNVDVVDGGGAEEGSLGGEGSGEGSGDGAGGGPLGDEGGGAQSGGGGGGGGGFGCSPLTCNVTATFDFVPTLSAQLDFTNIIQKRICFAQIELLDSLGVVECSGVTDVCGQITFTPSATGNYTLKVYPKTGLSYADYEVVDFSLNPTPPITKAISLSSSSNVSIHASSGWDPSLGGGAGGYNASERQSGPFSILEALNETYEAFRGISGTLDLSVPLKVAWDQTTSPTGWKYFTSSTNTIYLNGLYPDDTDEYDVNILVHEWIHYFEHNYSRSDSPGGSHFINDPHDMRLAWGEGFANGMGAIIKNRIMWDTGTSTGWGIDMEENSAGTAAVSGHGWYNEMSCGRLLYDLYDTNADVSDNINIGTHYERLRPIVDVFTSTAYKNSPAFMSVFTFITHLKALPYITSGYNTNVDILCSKYNINPITSIWGVGETHDNGYAENLPIYHTLILGAAATTLEITRTYTDRTNEAGNRRFIKFVGSGANYTFSSSSASNHSVIIYTKLSEGVGNWGYGLYNNTSHSQNFSTINNRIYAVVVWGDVLGTYNISITLA